ncbi:uncharacterized protein [Temnothorax nylanderi]|uniref:uncharacterized protein n=1 Tax=Temnothorax nylanderi TaxID=102681 RepID=UPI003A868B0B
MDKEFQQENEEFKEILNDGMDEILIMAAEEYEKEMINEEEKREKDDQKEMEMGNEEEKKQKDDEKEMASNEEKKEEDEKEERREKDDSLSKRKSKLVVGPISHSRRRRSGKASGDGRATVDLTQFALQLPLLCIVSEHFYNPKTGTGYIASRLSNVQRKESVSKIIINKRQKENIENIEGTKAEHADETEVIKDSIDFMKHATLEQKDQIIEKTKKTFKVRRYLYLNKHFFNVFPRFLDTPELINVEFNLLFPNIEKDKFCEIYVEYVPAILTVYETEKNNISLGTMESTLLLPPTARGKKLATRDKANNIVRKLIAFVQNGTPLHSNENVNQPRLILVGPNKIAPEQCFLEIDKKFILLPTNNIIKSIDYLFKAHYVFHVEFENDLKNFLIFLQHYFYKIPSKCTSKLIEVHTKFEAA